MVETTKGKNIIVETYDADYEELLGNGTRAVFGVPDPAAETNIKYSRAYVETEEAEISSIAAGTAAAITGTSITVTDESTTVTGVGTSFLTQVAPGNAIRLNSIGTYYKVRSIESNTSLTLAEPHVGNGTGAGTVKGAKVTLSTAPSDNSLVELFVPTTKNAAFTVQQDVKFSIDTKTEDIKELGNDAITRDVVEKTGTLELALAQAKNHTTINKLALNSKNDTWMVIAVKYKNTDPASYRIFKEARVNEIGGDASAGAVATEQATFNWKPPLEIKTS
ncbi:MAG: hypothetical protein SCH70_07805 [Candidatus Methanoperedens sp.]|nr:hypothetical protein [Candidatus Methanoperedens sp.]